MISFHVPYHNWDHLMEEPFNANTMAKFLRTALPKIENVSLYSILEGVDMVDLAELLPAMKYLRVYRTAIEEAAGFIELHAAVQLKPTEEELKARRLRILGGSRPHKHSVGRSIYCPCAVQALCRCQKIVLHSKVPVYNPGGIMPR